MANSHAGAGDSLADLYRCVDAPQVRITIRAAEAIKFACNAFHAMKITFANEIGQFCKAHGIDSHEVMDIVCRDTKLNISTTVSQTWHGLWRFLPSEGSTCPCGTRPVKKISSCPCSAPSPAATSTRSNAPSSSSTELGHREVGILGLSFKMGTDDLRESPIVHMAGALLGKGFKLVIHDPEVELTRLTGANKRFLEEKLPHIGSLLGPLAEAVGNSRTVVICKNSPDYRKVSDLISPLHEVVDLVGTLKGSGIAQARYHGLYW